MNYSAPKSFYLKSGPKAVLLLHTFTGTTIDVRKLGKFLHAENYTVMAPMYSGHGENAFTLLQYGVEDWWEDVQAAYEFLEDEGFEDIAVVGISLGAVLALKVADELSPKALVTMSLPMSRDEVTLRKRVVNYAKNHQQYEDQSAEQKAQDLIDLKKHPMPNILQFTKLIDAQSMKIDRIQIPTFALYGMQDDELYKKSAENLISKIQSEQKQLKGYEKAGHLMTFGPDAARVNAEILEFLERSF